MGTHKIDHLPRRVSIMLQLTALLVILLVVHSLIRHSIIDYTYLIWNFILAAIPATMIYLYRYRHSRRFHTVLCAVVALIWLAFLPNTFYLLTEFTHLNPNVVVNLPGNYVTRGIITYGRGSALYNLDTLIMLVTTIFGAYAGSVALFDGFSELKRRTTKRRARGLFAALVVIVALGTYIGRYGRWNSWDILVHPGSIISGFVAQLTHFATLERFLLFIGTMILFEIISLYVTYQLKLTDDISQ